MHGDGNAFQIRAGVSGHVWLMTRTSSHGAKARICLGLSIVVNRPGATCRRSSSGQSVKGRRAVRPKPRKAPTVSTDHSAAQFDRLKSERDEALEQVAATSEILRVIRTSPTDAQPVFETIVRNAVSLCGSLYANVF